MCLNSDIHNKKIAREKAKLVYFEDKKIAREKAKLVYFEFSTDFLQDFCYRLSEEAWQDDYLKCEKYYGRLGSYGWDRQRNFYHLSDLEKAKKQGIIIGESYTKLVFQKEKGKQNLQPTYLGTIQQNIDSFWSAQSLYIYSEVTGFSSEEYAVRYLHQMAMLSSKCVEKVLPKLPWMLDIQSFFKIVNTLKANQDAMEMLTSHVEMPDLYAAALTQLLEENALFDPNEEDSHNDFTILHCIIRTGQLSLVRALVERGAGVNDETDEYEYPLSIAAKEGFQDIFDYLLPLSAKRVIELTRKRYPSMF